MYWIIKNLFFLMIITRAMWQGDFITDNANILKAFNKKNAIEINLKKYFL
jgi:hypothetical protein